MFEFLKKDAGQAPPDVGQEEVFDKENAESKGEVKESEKSKSVKKPKDVPASEAEEVVESKKEVPSAKESGVDNLQIEKVNVKINLIEERLKQFNEKFSFISESIGEIRATNLENEKKISQSMVEAEKVIDVVKEVKPESLRVDYQKMDIKVSTLGEKIEANSQFMNEIMSEINDLKRKSEIFVGTEGLMKLNEDIKKDLIETQKLSSKTKMQADKAQEIFMELRKGFAESQKVGAVVTNLDESYSGLKDLIEKLKLDYENVVKYSDYLDFKKTYGNKLSAFESEIADVKVVRESIGEISNLIETNLSISRRNEEDIGNLGLKIGDESVKSVSDYENQLVDMIEIIEKLFNQISEIRNAPKAEPSVVIKKVPVPAVAAKKEDDVESAEAVKSETVPKPSESQEVVNSDESAEVVEEKALKPSENQEVVDAVNAVKVAEVPVSKPEEFLGKKNLFLKKVEKDIGAKILDIKNKLQKRIGSNIKDVAAGSSELGEKKSGVRSSELGAGAGNGGAGGLPTSNSQLPTISEADKLPTTNSQLPTEKGELQTGKKKFEKKKVVKKNLSKIQIKKRLKNLEKARASLKKKRKEKEDKKENRLKNLEKARAVLKKKRKEKVKGGRVSEKLGKKTKK